MYSYLVLFYIEYPTRFTFTQAEADMYIYSMQVALERVVDAKNAGIMSSGVSKLCEERRKLNINIAGDNTLNANRRQT